MSRQGSRNNGPGAGNANKVSGRTRTEPPSNAKEEATPAKRGEALTKPDRERLQQLETTIGSGLTSSFEVGRALKQINSSRLYREVSDTFEDYCELKWDLSSKYCYRLIKAAECFDLLRSKLRKGVRLPSNESQLRPMVDALKPGKWVEAWKQVIADTSGARLTAEAVEKVVQGFGGQSKPSKPLVRKKALPNVSKGLAKVVAMVKSALDRRAAKLADHIKTLQSVLRELKALQEGPLQPRG